VRIVTRLCDGGPCSTFAFTRVIAVSRQAGHQTSVVARGGGLVSSESQAGNESGESNEASYRRERLPDALSVRWDDAIDRLRPHLSRRIDAGLHNLRISVKRWVGTASACKNAVERSSRVFALAGEELVAKRTYALRQVSVSLLRFCWQEGPVRPWRSPTQLVHTPVTRISKMVQLRGAGSDWSDDNVTSVIRGSQKSGVVATARGRESIGSRVGHFR